MEKISFDGDPRKLVFHIVYDFSTGGLENGVVNLINHFPSNQFRHAVVALTECAPSFCERITVEGVQFFSLHKALGHGFKLYPRLYRLFREYCPTIVHTRNLAALESLLPAYFARVPIRVHGEHGLEILDVWRDRLKNRFFRRLYRPFVMQYIALSKELEAYLENEIGISPKRIERICNGVDIQRFYSRGKERASLENAPFNDDPSLIVIGSVGRLQFFKDQVNLVSAFARVCRFEISGVDKLRLAIVGEGPLREEIEQKILACGIGNQVWLAGERMDVPDVMRSFDLFVLPSRTEGISNTILEAMSSALPVVATNVGGNSELVQSGITGTLVPAENPEALAAAIAAYVADPAMRVAHGRAGRKRVETEFSIEIMVSRYAALYQRLVEENRLS